MVVDGAWQHGLSTRGIWLILFLLTTFLFLLMFRVSHFPAYSTSLGRYL